MIMSEWNFYLEDAAWQRTTQLMIVREGAREGIRSFVLPFSLAPVEDHVPYGGPPTLDGPDFDVRGFLQAALEAAWNAGLRPLGFSDVRNELAAVRYHLEDMRKLAKLKA